MFNRGDSGTKGTESLYNRVNWDVPVKATTDICTYLDTTAARGCKVLVCVCVHRMLMYVNAYVCIYC